MFLKLAWLNIWRNKRRTLITMASVFFAVILAILMRSMTDGVYDNMIHNMVSYSSGYIQIHSKGYWDEQSIDNSFEQSNALLKTVSSNSSITEVLPRLESFALASFTDKTKGVLVLGIDPGREKLVNTLHEKVSQGDYIESKDDNAIVIGEGLASQLKLEVNDTLVLLGQGYHASTAAGKFRVKGLIKLGSPELNNGVVYVPLLQAQQFFGAENRLTALSVILEKSTNLNAVKAYLEQRVDNNLYEVMTWKEMMPEMVQFIEADSISNKIFIGILYFIISFGLFGTLLMMAFERNREFGMLIAVGMKKEWLAFILLLESVMISLLGCLAGIMVGFILVHWFTDHPIYFTGKLKEVYENYGFEPIIYFSTDEGIFWIQTLIVLILSLVLTLYPAIKVMRLKPIEAINS